MKFINRVDAKVINGLILALFLVGVYMKFKSSSLSSSATSITLSSLYNCDFGTDFVASNECISSYVERGGDIQSQAKLYENVSYFLMASSVALAVVAFKEKLLFFQK